MDDPKSTIQKEPRKSLFVLFAASTFFTVIGLVVLFFGSPEREPMVRQGGTVAIIIGVLGFLLYFYARWRGEKGAKQSAPRDLSNRRSK